jgi:hypothetical protein
MPKTKDSDGMRLSSDDFKKTVTEQSPDILSALPSLEIAIFLDHSFFPSSKASRKKLSIGTISRPGRPKDEVCAVVKSGNNIKYFDDADELSRTDFKNIEPHFPFNLLHHKGVKKRVPELPAMIAYLFLAAGHIDAFIEGGKSKLLTRGFKDACAEIALSSKKRMGDDSVLAETGEYSFFLSYTCYGCRTTYLCSTKLLHSIYGSPHTSASFISSHVKCNLEANAEHLDPGKAARLSLEQISNRADFKRRRFDRMHGLAKYAIVMLPYSDPAKHIRLMFDEVSRGYAHDSITDSEDLATKLAEKTLELNNLAEVHARVVRALEDERKMHAQLGMLMNSQVAVRRINELEILLAQAKERVNAVELALEMYQD